MLQPLERIEILKMNRETEFFKEEEGHDTKGKKKLFFLSNIPTLFKKNAAIDTFPIFLETVKVWLELFMTHFEYGYQDPSELFNVLQTMKTALVPINQVNYKDFSVWIYGFIRKFLKIALFRLVDKIFLELHHIKKKSIAYLSELGEEGGGMNFGRF